MPVKLTVSQLERGPTVTLILSCCTNRGTPQVLQTKDLQIDDLVKVRFKLEFKANQLKCNWSAMKLKSEVHSVQMMVKCPDVKYSELSQIHTEAWTDFKYMGTANTSGKNKLYVIQMYISVCEVNASNSHKKVYENIDRIDFHLKASDGEVGVHRVFLAAHSDVFKGMLNGQWKEAEEGCVEVEGVTRQTLQHLKDYMYLDTLPEDGLQPLLMLAKYYLMDDLKTKCIKKLAETVDSNNLHDLMKFACENNIPELTLEILFYTPNEIVHNAHVNKKRRTN